MKHIRLIKKFDADYYRIGEVSIVEGKCVLCDKEKRCIFLDSSEGEYGGACICVDCVKREIEREIIE